MKTQNPTSDQSPTTKREFEALQANFEEVLGFRGQPFMVTPWHASVLGLEESLLLGEIVIRIMVAPDSLESGVRWIKGDMDSIMAWPRTAFLGATAVHRAMSSLRRMGIVVDVGRAVCKGRLSTVSQGALAVWELEGFDAAGLVTRGRPGLAMGMVVTPRPGKRRGHPSVSVSPSRGCSSLLAAFSDVGCLRLVACLCAPARFENTRLVLGQSKLTEHVPACNDQDCNNLKLNMAQKNHDETCQKAGTSVASGGIDMSRSVSTSPASPITSTIQADIYVSSPIINNSPSIILERSSLNPAGPPAHEGAEAHAPGGLSPRPIEFSNPMDSPFYLSPVEPVDSGMWLEWAMSIEEGSMGDWIERWYSGAHKAYKRQSDEASGDDSGGPSPEEALSSREKFMEYMCLESVRAKPTPEWTPSDFVKYAYCAFVNADPRRLVMPNWSRDCGTMKNLIDRYGKDRLRSVLKLIATRRSDLERVTGKDLTCSMSDLTADWKMRIMLDFALRTEGVKK
jgi:hypothetical protein